MSGFREECAVFGVYGSKQAALHVALGLHALQHRGQEATGIVSLDDTHMHSHRGMGHVGKHFDAHSDTLDKLIGTSAIGHNRYPTHGGSDTANIQPFTCHLTHRHAHFHPHGTRTDIGTPLLSSPDSKHKDKHEGNAFALAHNGNLRNADDLRHALTKQGIEFQTTSDTEVIIHLLGQAEGDSIATRLAGALEGVKGAYSLLALSDEGMIAVRDPLGIRPLVLGKLPGGTGKTNNTAWVVSSETCGFDIIGAEYVRDISPGEVLVIDKNGSHSFFPFAKHPHRFCVFEYIYFARPDSIIEHRHVYQMRKNIGKELAQESPIDADVIVPVPDSGVPAALGYAEESAIPFDLGIIRSHYVGRSFIQPTTENRQTSVKLKHSANRPSVDGKRIILVDDSIVRGTTSMRIVAMMREAGAKEVHMRIASPPTTHPCFYGVDTPDQDNLIAAQLDRNTTALAEYLNSDSVAFVSLDGLYRALGETKRNNALPQFCDACFSGEYPDAPNASKVPNAADAQTNQDSLLQHQQQPVVAE